MLQKAKGIVLHTVKYSETSVIASIYTREYGKLSFIVQGVRNIKSKNKAALLQPMNILDLEIYLRENKNLLRLKEFRCSYIYNDISFNVLKSSVGLFYIEVLHKVIKEEEPNMPLFDFIFNEFISLDHKKGNISLLPQFFLLRLAAYLGFQPRNNYSDSSSIFDLGEGCFVSQPSSFNLSIPANLSISLHQLLNALNSNEISPTINYTTRKELLDILVKYYTQHVSNLKSLNTLKVLEEVLS